MRALGVRRDSRATALTVSLQRRSFAGPLLCNFRPQAHLPTSSPALCLSLYPRQHSFTVTTFELRSSEH